MTPAAASSCPRGLAAMASLRVTVVGLLYLLVLTVWGTLYQVEHGLYPAQQRFYAAWLFLAGGWVPLPGAILVMSVLFLNLLASVLYMAAIGRLRASFLLTHGGLMLMLAAGGMTFYLAESSYLTLAEGEGANVSTSNREWEIAGWPATGDPARRAVSAVSPERLRPGTFVDLAPGGLSLAVECYYRHCVPVPETGGGSGGRDLAPVPAPSDPAERIPGARVRLRTADGSVSERVLYGGDPTPVVIEAGAEGYAVVLRPRRLPLPVTIELVDFRREDYAGSRIARSFSSRVIVRGVPDGPGREVLISMNKPLREKGFTFYQSSYSSGGGREASTLAVVRNYGRQLPYLATVATVAGMGLHFLGMLVRRTRRDASGGARE